MADQAEVRIIVPEAFKVPARINTFRACTDDGRFVLDFGHGSEDTIDLIASVDIPIGLLESFLEYIFSAMKEYEETSNHRFSIFHDDAASASQDSSEGEA
jgi:hypothetical protein